MEEGDLKEEIIQNNLICTILHDTLNFIQTSTYAQSYSTPNLGTTLSRMQASYFPHEHTVHTVKPVLSRHP